ncbi:hypothetical protein PsorP6_017584 [Peronosclerospora sorghi]|uniref:Uncharacterized protein n=1 Tax=Peronosclerospora sorghi TaxID=230839 RepID=A0ACC0WMH4_9STRA|nr:hypothetical protein PsorP6_017584 [Peronosclerospora sorghi]
MWFLRVMNTEHNQEPSDTPAAHPMHRRMMKETMQHVAVKMNSNITPRQIIASMWESAADCSINQYVYNACKRIRHADMGVSTSIEASLDRIQV